MFVEDGGLFMSFSHGNLVISRSGGLRLICKNAFSMSAINPILLIQNLINNPARSSSITGPR